MTARTDAQEIHERRPATVLEADIDYCDNEFGLAPCTAGRTGETGTAQAGGASTLTLRAGASAVDDAYNGLWLGLRTGAGSIQSRKVLDYVGATKVATVAKPWRVNRIAYSAQLDQWGGTAVVLVNQGHDSDGALKLDKLTDNDAGAFLSRNRSITVPNDGATYVIVLEVVKDTTATQRAGINLSLSGGVTVNVNPRFALDGTNLASCTVAEIPASGGRPAILRVRASITNNTSGNTTLNMNVYPATSATKGGVDNVAAVGSMTCGHAHVRASTESDDYIESAATAVTVPDNTTVYDMIDRSSACYNVFLGRSPCQDTANYVKGLKTIKFVTRGTPPPAGETLLPYLMKMKQTPTAIDPDKGLAARSKTSITFVDDVPAVDDLDKYVTERATPAQGSYWPRFIARNPNAVGRFARLRRGYVTDPVAPLSSFYDTFQTELYVIDSIQGPDSSGRVRLDLTDAIKLLDRSKLPVPTDGTLLAELKGVVNAGIALAGSLTTIQLATKASAADDAYNGMEVFILENTGAGQRRVIVDYVGATRIATVAAWTVEPDTTSVYEVTQLSISMPTGKGTQYPDPATSGKQEYIRLGDEVIRYTAKAGDVLSWADGSYRAQFGTTRSDHRAKDAVILCRAWIEKPASEVVNDIINEGGLADTYIDLAGLATEDADWIHEVGIITACITDPETTNKLLADLCVDLNLMTWWHPVEQKVKFKADTPSLPATLTSITDANFLRASTKVTPKDEERITRAAVNFDIFSATDDRKLWKNYRTAAAFIDTEKEGPNAYNDVRQYLRQSRWMTDQNQIFTRAQAQRRVLRFREAPAIIVASLDPRDEVQLGELVDVTTRKYVDAAGAPLLVRCRVVRVVDNGEDFDLELRTTAFLKRYGFICPAGYPNYGAASDEQRKRAFISSGATMSDGSSAYLIS